MHTINMPAVMDRHACGEPIAWIARDIGVDRSTLSRRLKNAGCSPGRLGAPPNPPPSQTRRYLTAFDTALARPDLERSARMNRALDHLVMLTGLA